MLADWMDSLQTELSSFGVQLNLNNKNIYKALCIISDALLYICVEYIKQCGNKLCTYIPSISRVSYGSNGQNMEISPTNPGYHRVRA